SDGLVARLTLSALSPCAGAGVEPAPVQGLSRPPCYRGAPLFASLLPSVSLKIPANQLFWPREESNLRTQIRSLPLYPLRYGAAARSMKGWRRGLEPPTTGTTTRGSTS